ncbi:MAG TPA: branched-chain amino acid ABC transporter permease [Hyphomicrobiales bacterium]|nr:branched-chain amino acid ABC transporter permease [Hyphomicrobiales bacterium]
MTRALVGFLVAVALAAALGAAGQAAGSLDVLRFLSEVLLYLAMAEMWNLLAGYAGLLCLGQQMFVGVGAYGLFYAALALNVSPYWVIPVAPLLGALFAAVSALFLFRLRVVFFAIGTWVLSEVLAAICSGQPVLGGSSGFSLSPVVPLVNFDWFDVTVFWIAAAIAILTTGGAYLLMRSPIGLGLMSVRDNDLAAASLGVDVWRNRFVAFVISGAGCAAAGAVYYMATLAVNPTQGFDPNWSVSMLFITIVGGIGTLEGPIIGTIIYFALQELFTNTIVDVWPDAPTGTLYLCAVGLVAMLAMLYAPNGLWPMVQGRFGVAGLSVRRRSRRAAALGR